MKIHKGAAVAALTLAVSVGATVTSSSGAQAASRSDYPKPVMQYVKHPAGFPDSTEVVRVGNKLRCSVPIGRAVKGDAAAGVRTDLVPLVTELMRQTEDKYHYNIRGGDTGGYMCRFIKRGGVEVPSLGPSNHAYGRAVDINWNTNPQSSTFRSDLPPAVVSLWIRHGFYWGGHYSGTPDTMHFEYVGARSAINGYYQHAVAEGKGTPPPPPPSTCPSATLASYPVVKSGSSGTAVKLAQCKLRTSGATITADGVFGSKTAAAVSAFQRSHGLKGDGVVGAHTWTALLAQGSSPTLKSGSRGADVTRLQQALRASGQSLSVDGVFGSGTARAVTAYQGRVGLKKDGVVGAQTWAALKAGK